MDNLILGQKLLSNKSLEEKARSVNPSSASIVYMIAVTASINGEVVLKDEVENTTEWEDDDFIEVDDDGDFEEVEEETEEVDDSVIDLTDGDGVDIEDAETNAVVTYHADAVTAYAETTSQEETEVVEDDLAGEDATVGDEIDDGDATELPDDVETSEEDELTGEEDGITDIEDDEYTLIDDNSDDESDENIEGAEISDGYTVAECIGMVKAGDRVAVVVQDGKMTVLGVVGSGDEQNAETKEAHEKADEAAKTATNFIGYDNENGLQIGNKTNGSWDGFRTQMNSSTFKILNGAGETLASYGAKLVELGKNATDAVIKFCGGKAKLSSRTYDDGRSSIALESDSIGLYTEDTEYAATRVDNQVEYEGYRAGNNLHMVAAKDSDGHTSRIVMKTNITAQEGSMGSGMHNMAMITMDSRIDGGNIDIEASESVTIKNGYEECVLRIEGDKVAIKSGGKKIELSNGRIDLPQGRSLRSYKKDNISTVPLIYLSDSENIILGYATASSAHSGDTIINAPNGRVIAANDFEAKGDMLLLNQKWLRAKDTSNKERVVIGLNSLDNIQIGSASQDTSHAGNTLITALNGNVKFECKNASVGLDHYDSDNSDMVAFFRPKSTLNNIGLGSSSYKWYRLYQYHESVSVSDEREKHDITAISELPIPFRGDGKNVLEMLFERLVPKIYQLNGEKAEKTHIGFIAQDISKSLEEIGMSEDELGLINHEYWTDEATGEEKDEYGLAYSEFIALNTYMIQKLLQENKEIKESLYSLKKI